MIFYFSGTGSSRKSAEQIGALISETVVSITDCNPYSQLLTGNSIGFICPVYSWGIPPIMLDFISHLPEPEIERISKTDIPVWVVLTYGDEAGNALSMIRRVLNKKGLSLKGAWGIQTPNVYVLLPGFDVDPKTVEKHKLDELKGRTEKIANHIMGSEWKEDIHRGPFASVKTALVYPLFKHWGINPKRWTCNHQTCISCAKCATACPVNNIAMHRQNDENPTLLTNDSIHASLRRYPIWGNDCTSCCACYHICPTNSISYGHITRNKGQYQPYKTP